ncbi:MAG: metal ABC transporter substrate-binding protein [Lachnospiraceae bacterium]|nr:metal ABC transporter substrate-binding protein [Lachnospiraceae bacterium]
MKKNRIVLCMVCILSMLTFCACGKGDDQKSIVCTVFPEYDWTREVLGDQGKDIELTLLMDNGVDLHSYQPTAQDIAKIANCDLFIYVGGESDEWVEDALKESNNPDMQVINLLDTLGDAVREEEIVEGMEGHDHEHEHEDGDEHEHEDGDEHDHEHEGPEYDEHVWLSLRNASNLVDAIESALAKIDSENASAYRENADAYKEKLAELDKKYTDMVSKSARKTVLFGDRFPYRYLVDDYGLDYYAAFVGCSAESEASFETMAFLAKKVDELQLPYVLINKGASDSIAKGIIQNTKDHNQTILQMDGIHSMSKEDREAGKTYLSVMEDNLKALTQALN